MKKENKIIKIIKDFFMWIVTVLYIVLLCAIFFIVGVLNTIRNRRKTSKLYASILEWIIQEI